VDYPRSHRDGVTEEEWGPCRKLARTARLATGHDGSRATYRVISRLYDLKKNAAGYEGLSMYTR
jgi:hypothetical protein